MKVLVTGGAGFIGANFIRHLIGQTDWSVVNLDALYYAANLESLTDISDNPRYRFEKADICDGKKLKAIFEAHRPDAVLHLAAESHVDRSIDEPAPFIQTNIVGTYTLLETALHYWKGLGASGEEFRFLHVSTDEVYGSLGPTERFTENSPYRPNSPYSASKASSDHLVRAWHRTFGLPALISNCSNNYGPYQFPEKLIPLTILNAISGKPLPVYGAGENVRDWLHVEDHASALAAILESGKVGDCYNVGGSSELMNIEVVRQVCAIIDELVPSSPYRPHADLIEFVADRPGHDLRYAIDSAKLSEDLGWRPNVNFKTGLRRTVEWYLANQAWWGPLVQQRYDGKRLGLGGAKT